MIKKIIKTVEGIAGFLGYKTVWRFVLETAAVLFAVWALFNIMELGWQENFKCVQYAPLIESADTCIKEKNIPVFECRPNFGGQYKAVNYSDLLSNNSYGYEPK